MSKDLLALNYEKTFRDRGSGFVCRNSFAGEMNFFKKKIKLPKDVAHEY